MPCHEKLTKSANSFTIYNLQFTIFSIHTNHDGLRAIAIMLRSIAASLSWRSPIIAVKQASDITLAPLRVNN